MICETLQYASEFKLCSPSLNQMIQTKKGYKKTDETKSPSFIHCQMIRSFLESPIQQDGLKVDECLKHAIEGCYHEPLSSSSSSSFSSSSTSSFSPVASMLNDGNTMGCTIRVVRFRSSIQRVTISLIPFSDVKQCFSRVFHIHPTDIQLNRLLQHGMDYIPYNDEMYLTEQGVRFFMYNQNWLDILARHRKEQKEIIQARWSSLISWFEFVVIPILQHMIYPLQ